MNLVKNSLKISNNHSINDCHLLIIYCYLTFLEDNRKSKKIFYSKHYIHTKVKHMKCECHKDTDFIKLSSILILEEPNQTRI